MGPAQVVWWLEQAKPWCLAFAITGFVLATPTDQVGLSLLGHGSGPARSAASGVSYVTWSEANGLSPDVISAYRQMTGAYPPLAPALVKLRLGYEYHRRREYAQAEAWYWEVLHEAKDSEILEITRQLLEQVQQLTPRSPSAHPAHIRLPTTRPIPLLMHSMTPKAMTSSTGPRTAGTPRLAEVLPSAVSAAAPALTVGTGIPEATGIGNAIPVFVRAFTERLSDYLELVGERTLTRKLTNQDLQLVLIPRIQGRFQGRVTDLVVRIHPEDFVGTAIVHVGPLEVPVQCRLGMTAVDDRPRVAFHELTLGGIQVPRLFLKLMEDDANRAIARDRLPLKIKQFELREGAALILVERV